MGGVYWPVIADFVSNVKKLLICYTVYKEVLSKYGVDTLHELN